MLETLMALALASSAFTHNGPIPRTYTCQGSDISVPLSWSGLPPRTKSLALVVERPGCTRPGGTEDDLGALGALQHPAGCHGLPQGVKPAELPRGTFEGINDWKRTGYGGPCPPTGRTLFSQIVRPRRSCSRISKAGKAQLEQAMKGHVLAQSELIGTYKKD
jgi:phosphatidylethanolamine-binding protein (PEBP) family uncharacterized protein